MKSKVLFLSVLLMIALFTGCRNNQNQGNQAPSPTPGAEVQATPTPPTQTTPPETTPDVVTTASIVNTEEAFKEAISNTGTWIICTVTDLTFDEDLVLDGEFKNGRKDDAGNDVIQRKIALYTQDENRKVTERFNLTAPKLTVNSPNARIQSGTFIGDVYVNAENFQLVDATVDGNIYFLTQEAQDTFTMDETSEITGEQQLQE